MERIALFNEDNLQVMKRLSYESIDVICIDPPYLYLKNQKLERPFDELKFFSECKRLLTKNGFIVMFGRGESFYRWNSILSNLQFKFKEEIVWDKRYTSSPVMNLSRVHENVSIFAKDSGVINLCKVPYIECKTDYNSIHQDLKRIKSGLNNPKSLIELLDYVEKGTVTFTDGKKQNYTTTLQSNLKTQDRAVKTIQTITEGLREKTIISIGRDHYSTIHPTQKPVRLIERLLALVIPKDKPREETVIADFFGGSMSCMEAVYNMEMRGIATEIDKQYFDDGKKRIDNLQPKQPELFDN